MPILKKLIIDGFKSFEKKIEIPLFNGFNAIVGPNGSGKSNIMDAITFVLGKRSASLRSDKLQNLIFNGGNGKKQKNTAEVSLIINNKQRIINTINEDEIILTRKVTQSGLSTYKINNKTQTKQTIDKVLSEIDIISDGHNIIKQGDITKIINMKPKERRGIIDEVAGIKDYIIKKNKSIDELAYAEKKLSDYKLIQKEKKIILNRLEKDKNSAEKYQKLQQKEEYILANLAFSRLKAVEETLNNVKNTLIIKEQETKKLTKDVNEYDRKLENLETELNKIDNELFDKTIDKTENNALRELDKKIIERESKIESYRRDITRLKEIIENLNIMKNTKTKNIKNNSIKTLLESNISGIHGTIETLMSIELKYQTAIFTLIKSHLNDIIVNGEQTAIECINHLKQNNAGRVRLLPLDRLKTHIKGTKSEIAVKMPGIIDYAINLIEFEPQYQKAYNLILKDTLMAEDIDSAKKIKNLKIITLDGDLFEPEGYITGGSKTRTNIKENQIDFSNIKKYEKEKTNIESQIIKLAQEIEDYKELKDTKESNQTKKHDGYQHLKEKREKIKEELENLKKNRRTEVEESLLMEHEIQNLKIRKARLEAEYDNLIIPYEKYKKRTDLKKSDPQKLEDELKKIERNIRHIGPINIKSIEEYSEYKQEYDIFQEKTNKLEQEQKKIINMIEEIEKTRKELFKNTFEKISKEFNIVYKNLTEGYGNIQLEDKNNIESGLIIKITPKGKKELIIDSLSGGEKTMASIAFLFAILNHKPSPFYILDEIDAALDSENARKVGEIVNEYAKKSQFLIISHNSAFVNKSKRIYGISMKKGVSTIIGIQL
jgi:chromosome segregation protein